MVDFISEVQEELRKDDYNKWLKTYGPWALGGIAIVVAGTGFMEWRKAADTNAASKTSEAFLSATDVASSGDVDQAVAQFLEISDTAPSGYSGLALMRAATLEIEQGNETEAISLLDRAAETFEKPRHIQLAKIKAVYILAGQGAYSDVITRSTPLAVEGEPFEFLARELLGFAHMESGDLVKARQEFSYLERTPGVPETIQARAKQSLGIMATTMDVVEMPSEAEEQATDEDMPEAPATPAETRPGDTE